MTIHQLSVCPLISSENLLNYRSFILLHVIPGNVPYSSFDFIFTSKVSMKSESWPLFEICGSPSDP